MDFQLADLEDVFVLRRGAGAARQPFIAADMGLDPGYQFAGAEGLADVIVSSQSQAPDLVDIFPFGRHHENGHILLRPYFPADLKAVHARQHDIQ